MTKIYLVDDDEDDRMLARQALESVIEGIDIIEFSDGNSCPT
jgi:CheY-like chemotaxis protein